LWHKADVWRLVLFVRFRAKRTFICAGPRLPRTVMTRSGCFCCIVVRLCDADGERAKRAGSSIIAAVANIGFVDVSSPAPLRVTRILGRRIQRCAGVTWVNCAGRRRLLPPKCQTKPVRGFPYEPQVDKRRPARHGKVGRPPQSPEAAPHSMAHVSGAMARSSQAPVLILTAPYASAIRIAMAVDTAAA